MKRTHQTNRPMLLKTASALAVLLIQAAHPSTASAHSQTPKPSGGVTWTDFHYWSRESGQSSVDVSQTPSQTTQGSQRRRKELLAAAAIEDAAQFYGSGEIQGMLPMLIHEFRALLPEATQMSDEEIIETIVQSAELLLDAANRADSQALDQH